jgi:predicted phosphodiesterase
MADSHIKVSTSDDYRYLKAESISREILANFVRDINNHSPPVDFAVHLGDITEAGTVQEFNWARPILDSLACPLYPVVGNHDNFQGDFKQNFLDFSGLDSTHYSFDYFGINFIVIDCTLPRYLPPYVHCDALVRARTARDLAAKPDMPAIILSHYNMWERYWNAQFDTTASYAEYMGVPWLREVLEDAGNVVAVINGHVHANRVEVHNDIHYIDVNATLVGRPSIRYFYVYGDRIEVDYEYISDENLFSHVEGLCRWCTSCFNPDSVCAFIEGSEEDRRFTIDYEGHRARVMRSEPACFEFEVMRDERGSLMAAVASEHTGVLNLSLYDVRGRRIDGCRLYKGGETMLIDLGREIPGLAGLSGGIYFILASLGDATRTRKVPVF